MRQNQIQNVPYLKDRRKELRNNPTPAEKRLWKALKNSGFKNRKFRRQQSIENYIVDFYCPEEKLIIELDGEIHNDPMQAEYDLYRDQRLTELGNKILRFENKLIFNNLEGVLDLIESNFSKPDTESE